MPTAKPTPTDVADALDGAADVLEVYGHRRGNWGDENVGFCIRGALCKKIFGDGRFLVGGRDGVDLDVYDEARGMRIENWGLTAVFRHLELSKSPELHWNPVGALVRWNDDPERTPYDVIDALRGAAKEVRNRAQL